MNMQRYKAQEIADILSLSVATVRKMLKNNEIKDISIKNLLMEDNGNVSTKK